MEAVLHRLKNLGLDQFVLTFGVLIVLSILAAAIGNSLIPLLLPIGVIVLGFGVMKIRLLFYLCLILIPLSTEMQFGNLGSDMPAEPLMWLLTGIGSVYIMRQAPHIESGLLRHPVSIALLFHLAWMFITVLTSSYPITSIKFFIAKLWYVVPFYVMTLLFLRKDIDLKRLILSLSVPLFFVLIYCLVRHAALGFTFEDVNKAMFPFFRNHVSYAALTTIVLPYILVGAFLFDKKPIIKYSLLLVAVVCLLAIQTSYTRAAYGSLLIGIAFVFVMKYRLTKIAIGIALTILIGLTSFIVAENRFFNFAPDYNKTITHTDFDNLLEATYKLEDISTMERVYRWVAGGYMLGEQPVVGFGPGNFYRFYKGYALESFRTYVSDNPEHSGIHNYYLMTAVEQGWIGLIIFTILAVAALFAAERAYHKAKTREERLAIIIFSTSLVINLSFQLMNDMIETDKAGPWFFLSLAGIVILDLRTRLTSNWKEG